MLQFVHDFVEKPKHATPDLMHAKMCTSTQQVCPLLHSVMQEKPSLYWQAMYLDMQPFYLLLNIWVCLCYGDKATSIGMNGSGKATSIGGAEVIYYIIPEGCSSTEES